MDAGLGYAWILGPEVVEGRRFVDIYTRDYRSKKYFDGHYAMVNHIKKKEMQRRRKPCGGWPLKRTPTI